MSCREKGSSVSRSRKFLALMFSCSTACSQEECSCNGAWPQPGTGSLQPGTVPAERQRTGLPCAHRELTAMALPPRGRLVEPQKPLSKVPHRALCDPRLTHQQTGSTRHPSVPSPPHPYTLGQGVIPRVPGAALATWMLPMARDRCENSSERAAPQRGAHTSAGTPREGPVWKPGSPLPTPTHQSTSAPLGDSARNWGAPDSPQSSEDSPQSTGPLQGLRVFPEDDCGEDPWVQKNHLGFGPRGCREARTFLGCAGGPTGTRCAQGNPRAQTRVPRSTHLESL